MRKIKDGLLKHLSFFSQNIVHRESMAIPGSVYLSRTNSDNGRTKETYKIPNLVSVSNRILTDF